MIFQYTLYTLYIQSQCILHVHFGKIRQFPSLQVKLKKNEFLRGNY